MKSNNQDIEVLEQVCIQPFQIEQAVAGLEMGDMDQSLLKYLDFLAGMVPVEAAYFLHVVPKFEFFRSLFEKDVQPLAGKYAVSEDMSNRMADKIHSNISRERNIDVEYDVREGNPLEELLLDAEEVGADLVIIGQKSKERSHGILAKKLARKVKANALVVPEKAKHTLKKILVPIDFSQHSVMALQTAVGIQKQLKEPAEIICVNVYEMPDFASFNISKTREQFHRMVLDDRMAALDAFVDAAAPNEKDRIYTTLLQRDMPWVPNYLMKYASKNEVDLIVIGAKGHSKVALLLMGSTTEQLLNINDSIPTLIVK